MEKKKILFVCLGNICRSPAAEGIMKKLVAEKKLEDQFHVDSAGILSYHRDELPDYRMRRHAERRGYVLDSHSRQVKYNDFFDFDLILAMDDKNYSDLVQMAPNIDSKEKVRRMTEYCSTFMADYIPDPYYGGADGFELVLDILEDACEGLLNHLDK